MVGGPQKPIPVHWTEAYPTSAPGNDFSLASPAINFTNGYGLPGKFNVYILEGGDCSSSVSCPVAWQSGEFELKSKDDVNIFLGSMSLIPGETYTFEIEVDGNSPLGSGMPGFSNFILTSTPHVQFGNSSSTYTGEVWEHKNVYVPFIVEAP
jgi:hypothetical protein